MGDFLFRKIMLPSPESLQTDWFKTLNCYPWPAHSPDLNPIGNLWNSMADKLAKRKYKFNKGLQQNLSAFWQDIIFKECRKLIASMPECVRACCRAQRRAH